MRMDGQADIGRVGTHLNRERGLGDEVTGIGATMPHPMIRSVDSSKRTLVTPSSLPSVRDRPDATHGNTPLPYFTPAAFASFSVTPTHATSGSV
jgi:hypothetical protein